MDKIKLSQEYVQNKELLYGTWYRKHLAIGFGLQENVEFKGELPSVQEIQTIFLNWVDKNKIKLHKLICVKFDYNKNKDTYHSTSQLAVAIAGLLAPDYDASFEIAHIMVEMGLDKFCQK